MKASSASTSSRAVKCVYVCVYKDMGRFMGYKRAERLLLPGLCGSVCMYISVMHVCSYGLTDVEVAVLGVLHGALRPVLLRQVLLHLRWCCVYVCVLV